MSSVESGRENDEGLEAGVSEEVARKKMVLMCALAQYQPENREKMSVLCYCL